MPGFVRSAEKKRVVIFHFFGGFINLHYYTGLVDDLFAFNNGGPFSTTALVLKALTMSK